MRYQPNDCLYVVLLVCGCRPVSWAMVYKLEAVCFCFVFKWRAEDGNDFVDSKMKCIPFFLLFFLFIVSCEKFMLPYLVISTAALPVSISMGSILCVQAMVSLPVFGVF